MEVVWKSENFRAYERSKFVGDRFDKLCGFIDRRGNRYLSRDTHSWWGERGAVNRSTISNLFPIATRRFRNIQLFAVFSYRDVGNAIDFL
jgi:hypothetical protein